MPEHYFAFKPGDSVHEYRVDAVLGQGTFGITYAAEDTNLGESVAIKEYLPSGYAVRDATHTVRPIGTEEADEIFSWGLESFSREAKSLARLRQRNVVRVRRLFRDHGTAYIVMDLVEGERFDQVLRRHPNGNYPADDLLRLMRALLRGLREVHMRGLLHRDLKPSNIIIDREGEPIMIDFGAARDLRVTRAGGVSRIFTAEYAPYEQQTPGVEQSPASDLYALGAILYKAITGDLPPHAVSRLSTDRYVRLAGNAAYAAYPPHLLQLIDRMLAVEMRDRPQSADDVLRALDEATVFVPLRPAAARPDPAPKEPSLALKMEPPPLDVTRGEPSRTDAPRDRTRTKRRTSLAVAFGAAAITAIGALAIASQTLFHAGWWNLGGKSIDSSPLATAIPATAPVAGAARGEATPSVQTDATSGATRPAPSPLPATGTPSGTASSADTSSAATASTGTSSTVAAPADRPSASTSPAGTSDAVASSTGTSSADLHSADSSPLGALSAGALSASGASGGPAAPLAISAEGRASSAEASSAGSKPASTELRAAAPTTAAESAHPVQAHIETPASETRPSIAARPRAEKAIPEIAAGVFDVPVPAHKPSPPPIVAPPQVLGMAAVAPSPTPKPSRPPLDVAALAPSSTSEPLPPPLDVAALAPPPAPKPILQSAPSAPGTPRIASPEERLAWVRVKYAVRPEDVKAFLDLYPNGEFTDEAHGLLAALSREALSKFNGTWRSFGPAGCAFTGVMELNQGGFTLILKQPNSSMWATGEISADGSIEKILGSSSNLVPSGRLPKLNVAPMGCRFEFALVDTTIPTRKAP